jgi:adenylosuccinate lyase
MPSQIPQEEISKAHEQIKSLSGFLHPIDGRYYEPKVVGYVFPEALHSYSLVSLRSYSKVLGDMKLIPNKVSQEHVQNLRREKVAFKLAEYWEEQLRHDVRGLVRASQEKVSNQAKSFVYLGHTSYCILNTAYSMALRDVAYEVIIPRAIDFGTTMIKRMREEAGTVMAGRTHRQQAIPTTVGHYFGEVLGGVLPPLVNFKESVDDLRGKFSGFVGTRAAHSMLFGKKNAEKIERKTLRLLGLKADEMTSQVVHQHWYTDYFAKLGLVCGGIAKFANDLRSYQQTEIGEITEQKLEGQVGSSTGAHKSNPINAEQVSGGLWSQYKSILNSTYDDILTDFQRDLRDSSNKRFYIPALVTIAYRMIDKATKIAEKMTIRREKMAQNLGISKRLICAEPLQLYLQKWVGEHLGFEFLDAHEHIRNLTNTAVETGKDLFDVVGEDELVAGVLKSASPEIREQIYDPKLYLGTAKESTESFADKWEQRLGDLDSACKRHMKEMVYI